MTYFDLLVNNSMHSSEIGCGLRVQSLSKYEVLIKPTNAYCTDAWRDAASRVLEREKTMSSSPHFFDIANAKSS